MAELVADCPRCGARKITFDLKDAIKVGFSYGWQNWYETFCVCRHCSKATNFILAENVNGDYKYVHQTGLTKITGAVNKYVKIESVVTLKDSAKIEPPEHLPEDILAIFREGATCLAVDCNNAAGTMFRLCIDMASRNLLPTEDVAGLNQKTRRDLGLRLPWLFENKFLPVALKELSTCVKEDGNDGAHRGSLSPIDAQDLQDFTFALLERLYTEPEKLKIAEKRREDRRAGK
ncbi:MAG: DUF4145 domain-containing protein [Burkholderiales bacterium]